MTRRTPLGLFFLLLGTAAFVVSLLGKPIPIIPLSLGAGLAVFGALLIDFTSTKDSLAQIWIYVGDVLPGGRRKGDPPAPGAAP